MAHFVDRVVLHAAGGDGGHGCVSVHREKFKPLGGPDGADGGDGGDVVLVVDPQTTTLLDYHHRPHRSAESGGVGEGDLRHGRRGPALELPVPDGTVVKDLEGNVLADLVGAGARCTIAPGGRAAWATRRWPRRSARLRASRCWARPASRPTSSWRSRPSRTSPWWATRRRANPVSSRR